MRTSSSSPSGRTRAYTVPPPSSPSSSSPFASPKSLSSFARELDSYSSSSSSSASKLGSSKLSRRATVSHIPTSTSRERAKDPSEYTVRSGDYEVNAGCIYSNSKYQLVVTVKHRAAKMLEKEKLQVQRDVVLVVDHSSSMEGPKLQAVQACLFYLLKEAPSNLRLGIVAVSMNPKVLVPLEKIEKGKAIQAVRKLKAEEGTDLHGGIMLAMDMLVRRIDDTSRPGSIIVLTDGCANVFQGQNWAGPAHELAHFTQQAVEQRRTYLRGALNLDFLIVGEDVDTNYLRELRHLAMLPFQRIEVGRKDKFFQEEKLAKLRAKTFEALAVATNLAAMEDSLRSIDVSGGSNPVQVRRLDEPYGGELHEPSASGFRRGNSSDNNSWGHQASYTDIPLCVGSHVTRVFQMRFLSSNVDGSKPLASVDVFTSQGDKISLDVPHFAHNSENPEALSAAADHDVTHYTARVLGEAAESVIEGDNLAREIEELRRMLCKAKKELLVRQSYWYNEMNTEQARNQLEEKVEYLLRKLDHGIAVLSHDVDKSVVYGDLLATQTTVTSVPREGWSAMVALPVRIVQTQAKTWYANFMAKIKDHWKKVKDIKSDDLDSLMEGTDKLVAEFKQRLAVHAAKTKAGAALDD